jgi:hypothetical protein
MDHHKKGFVSIDEVLSTDDMNARIAVLLQIETSFLPQVRQQLADLLKSLPLDIDVADPDPRGGLEILPTLKANFFRLSTAIQSLVPSDEIWPDSRIDCSYGVLKQFRLSYLGRKYKILITYKLYGLLDAYGKFFFGDCFPRFHLKDKIVQGTEDCFRIIDGMMRYSKRSDHDIIQESWQPHLESFNSILAKQTERINQTVRPIQPDLLSLFQATIHITKLVRIFYKRIISTPASKPRFTFDAQMSSWQLLLLQSEVTRIYQSLMRLFYTTKDLDEYGHTDLRVANLRMWIKAPAEYLYSSSAMIFCYHVPLASGLDCHPPENLFKTLFLDLLTQFREASEHIQTLTSRLAPSFYHEFVDFRHLSRHPSL